MKLTALAATTLALGVGVAVALAVACSGGSDGGGGDGSDSPEGVGRSVAQAYIDGDTATLERLLEPDKTDYVFSVSERKLSGCAISQVLSRESYPGYSVTVLFEAPCVTECSKGGGCSDSPFSKAHVGVAILSGRMYWDGYLWGE